MPEKKEKPSAKKNPAKGRGRAAPKKSKGGKDSSKGSAGKKGAAASKVEKSGSRAKDPVKAAAGKKGGQAGGKTGGRKPGTPNKRTVELREALEELGLLDEDKHPVIQMQMIALGMVTMPVVVTEWVGEGKERKEERHVEDIPLEPALRVTCFKEVAQYLEAKRKAIEVSGPDGGAVVVKMVNLDELEPSGVGTDKS